MTAQTPVYGIKYPVAGEPIRTTRQILEDNARTVEAALVRGGIAPPAAQDLATLSGRVTALETGTAGTIAAATGWTGAGLKVALFPGGLVRLGGWVTNTGGFTPSGNGAEVLATITSPAHRPSAVKFFQIPVSVGQTSIQVNVNTNGTIVIARPSSVAVPAGCAWSLDGVVWF
jgi:hypothetical protein